MPSLPGSNTGGCTSSANNFRPAPTRAVTTPATIEPRALVTIRLLHSTCEYTHEARAASGFGTPSLGTKRRTHFGLGARHFELRCTTVAWPDGPIADRGSTPTPSGRPAPWAGASGASSVGSTPPTG